MTSSKTVLDGLFSNSDVLEASLLFDYNKIDHQFLARYRPCFDHEFLNEAIHFVSDLKTSHELREVLLVFSSTQILFISFDSYLLMISATREISSALFINLGKTWLQNYYRSQNPSPFEESVNPSDSKALLQDEPIDPAAWISFREKLEGILSKVLSFSMCIQLIEKSCIELGLDPLRGIPPNWFRKLGVYVIQKVPNQSKQKTLLADFEELMNRSPK